LALHSWQLKFIGPDDKEYELEAPLSKDLKALLQQLSKRKKGSAKQNR
jgi:23S rRNA pseudouridine955/2504/2580 synthase/23S rRNA pseudouridine1911/1915/1917 synthase